MSARAVEKIGELESAVGRPIIARRVVLHQGQNPRIPRSARAEGEVRLDGHPIRGTTCHF